MYAIRYITLYYYIDVVVYWRYKIYYTIVTAQLDGFCQKQYYYMMFVQLHFWNYSGDRGSHVGQPWLKNAKYPIRLRRISNRTHDLLSCHVNTFLLQFNSNQFNLLTCTLRSAKPCKSQHKYINTDTTQLHKQCNSNNNNNNNNNNVPAPWKQTYIQITTDE